MRYFCGKRNVIETVSGKKIKYDKELKFIVFYILRFKNRKMSITVTPSLMEPPERSIREVADKDKAAEKKAKIPLLL